MIINNSLRINTCSIKKNLTKLLINIIDTNLFYIDSDGNDILDLDQKKIIKKNILNDLKQNINYNLYLSIEDGYCIHKFQKGKRIGEYCNRKIYIKNGKNIELYCSRHNNNYDITPRNYEKNNQCEYIRTNGLQCKNHSKYNNFCFVHKNNSFVMDPFIKLNKLRNIYYQNIKKKRKKRIENYFKQNKKEKQKEKDKNNKHYLHNPTNLYVEESSSGIFRFKNIFKRKKKKRLKINSFSKKYVLILCQ